MTLVKVDRTPVKLLAHLAVIAILTIMAIVYYGNIIHDLPFGMHEWAQSDRLSVAIKFYDNGMDFFRPTVHNFRGTDGVVGVELPVQAYLAALLGKFFGRGSISTNLRVLDILMAMTGLYFLFRAVYETTRHFVVSLVAPVFIFCCPVYVFYSGNYLPDPFAAGIVYIAFYFLIRYLRTAGFRNILLGIALAALAVMIKSTVVSYLAGILFCGFYCSAFREKNTRKTLTVIGFGVLSAVAVLANIHHIHTLDKKYNSTIFMAAIHPIESWEAFTKFLGGQYKYEWMHEYFSLAQYPVYFMLIGIGVITYIRQRALRKYLIPLSVFFVSAMAVFYLFSGQFQVHDYIFVGVMMPLVAYCLVLALIALHERFSAVKSELNVGLSCAIAMIFFLADHQVYTRMHATKDFYDNNASVWMHGGDKLLDRLGIPKNEKIVAGEQDAPNLALVYFDRNGYNMPTLEWKQDMGFAENFLKERKVRILVLHSLLYQKILEKDSTSFSKFDVLATEDYKAVLRLK